MFQSTDYLSKPFPLPYVLLSLLWSLRNQIANVDFLLVPLVSDGLHRAGRFGGLQFAQICVEC
ncbi:hypothetical protein A2U01_0064010, partial [Trifolium medium]|nr:hypothetical protein [Trifolium medium]